MTSEGFENFSIVVTSLAAVVAVYVGWMGLNTWKSQIEFSTDSELAKKILVLLYRHFDSLLAVRVSPVYSSEVENPAGTRELPIEESRQHFLQKSMAYQKRFAKVSEVRAELYPLLIEGQAYWGREFQSLFDGLWKLERELELNIRLFLSLSNPDKSIEYKQSHLALFGTKRDIIHDRDAATDLLSQDYSRELTKLEDFLRGKLGRRPR
jgi:hypothetical protein